jgi:hypothetical protein
VIVPLRSSALVWLLAALSGAAWPQPGRALENAAAPSYEVPRGCAERADWLASVVARLPPLLQTHPLLTTLSVRVQIIASREGDVYAGELMSSSAASLADARSVRGATCDEVLDALSLVGALGLERIATRTAIPNDAGEAAAVGPAANDLAANDAAAIGAEAPVAASPARRGARLGAVAFALWQGALVPGQPLALGAGVRWAWSTPAWQPLILVGASASLPEERSLEGGGRVRYEHWSTHAVACPWRFPQSGAWGVRPCAELDVGRSSGEGVNVDAAARRSAPWLSAGAQLRAELAVWDRLELGVSFAAIAPLWRAHFFFYPGVERFDTPALGFRSNGSATVLF